MEIRWNAPRRRGLWLLGFSLLALGFGGLLLRTRFVTAQENLPAASTLPPLIKPDAFSNALPEARPTLPLIDITFADESSAWDWQWDLACKPKLEVYLGQRYPLSAVAITLVDDPTISLGVAYPEMGAPEAVALASCAGEEGVLHCRVAVGQGQQSTALNVATTVAPVYAISELLRPKDRQTWERQAPWDWSTFAPLITQKEGTWQSACVTLSPA